MEYKVVQAYGRFNELRWEVQEKYYYYNEDGEKIEAWHMVFHSSDKTRCMKVMEKYLTEPRKKYKISIEDALMMWR